MRYFLYYKDGDVVGYLASGKGTISSQATEVSFEQYQEILGELGIAAPEPQPEPPTTEDDLLSMAVDHEYRLTLLELGVI